MRLGLRGRTTVGFGLVFFLVGAAGVAAGYVLLSRAIDRQNVGPTPAEVQAQIEQVASETGVTAPDITADGLMFPSVFALGEAGFATSDPAFDLLVLPSGEPVIFEVVEWLESRLGPELSQGRSTASITVATPADFDAAFMVPVFEAAASDPTLIDDFTAFVSNLTDADGQPLLSGALQFDGELCSLQFENCEAAIAAIGTLPTTSELAVFNEVVTEALRRAEAESKADTLRSYVQISLLLLVATTAGAVAIGWIMSHRMLRPVREVTAAATAASVDSLHRRINLDGPDDELRQLADTFDGMLERLEEAFEAQRRFSSNAAHQLKTPLAVIRAELDAAASDVGVTEREQVLIDRLSTATVSSADIVESLLALAHAQHGSASMAPVDLALLVGEAAAVHAVSFGEKELRVRLDLPDSTVDAVVAGDEMLLGQLVANLLDNASKYATPGSVVGISVSRNVNGVRLVVRNDGPELDGETLAQLREPYRRGDGRVGDGGHGLGLTIVGAVAEVHDARLVLESPATGGLRVEVTFPPAH